MADSAKKLTKPNYDKLLPSHTSRWC